MSALNIEHLELILHLRFAVKVIAGFDIISHSLQIKREFSSPQIQEGSSPRPFHLRWRGSSLPSLPVTSGPSGRTS